MFSGSNRHVQPFSRRLKSTMGGFGYPDAAGGAAPLTGVALLRRAASTVMLTALLLGIGSVHNAGSLLAADAQSLIKTIKAVGPKGAGHTAAVAAQQELSKGSTTDMLLILDELSTASPLAANWLRGAFEAIADREWNRNHKLPTRELETLVSDLDRNAVVRRLAYDWLLKADPSAAERLIPGMLHDPGAEFRRDAVARWLKLASKEAEAGNKSAALELYRQAFSGATDDDQIKQIVGPLREAGETVDLPRHFGFLLNWKLIGPFDNSNLQGFDVVYPPENGIDFAAMYPGKSGDVGWVAHTSEDEYGLINIATALAPHKGAITYAATQFTSDANQTVEFRLGTPNAWKLWVNGELVFARDEYHRGMFLDQYRVSVPLKKGANSILLKVCQNEQTEPWAQDWQYQLRVCDRSGLAILPSEQKSAAATAVDSPRSR